MTGEAFAAGGQKHAALARLLYTERRRRNRYFDDQLFADPAWDILLDLYACSGEKREVYVSSACIAASVPMTTGLRYLRLLEQTGLIERYRAMRDGRRVLLRLSAQATSQMTQLLTDAGCRRSASFVADQLPSPRGHLPERGQVGPTHPAPAEG